MQFNVIPRINERHGNKFVLNSYKYIHSILQLTGLHGPARHCQTVPILFELMTPGMFDTRTSNDDGQSTLLQSRSTEGRVVRSHCDSFAMCSFVSSRVTHAT